LEFAVSAYVSSVAGDKWLGFNVNGVQVFANGSFSTGGTPLPSGIVLVPNGATYSAQSIGSSAVGLYKWFELR
jgi:hypothetical protein